MSREYADKGSNESRPRRTSISSHEVESTSPSRPRSEDAPNIEHLSISETDPIFSGPGPLFTPDSTAAVLPQSIVHSTVIPFSTIGHNRDIPERSIYPAQRDKYPLGPLKGLPDSASKQAFVTNIEEACLIRYFVDYLALWVGIHQHIVDPSLTLSV